MKITQKQFAQSRALVATNRRVVEKENIKQLQEMHEFIATQGTHSIWCSQVHSATPGIALLIAPQLQEMQARGKGKSQVLIRVIIPMYKDPQAGQ